MRTATAPCGPCDRLAGVLTALIAGGLGCDPPPGGGLRTGDGGPPAPDRADAGAPDADPSEPPEAAPPVAVGPRDLGFGRVVVGRTATRTVELRHDGPPATYRVLAPPPCTEPGIFCHVSAPERVADGARYRFDVAYRPAARAPHRRDRGEIVVARADAAPYRLPIDGEPTRGPSVRCHGPSALEPAMPGGCTEVPVRCVGEGPGEPFLTALDVGLDVPGAVIARDPVPSPTDPQPMAGARARWRFDVCPDVEGDYTARVRYAVTDTPGGPERPLVSPPLAGRIEPPALDRPGAVVVEARRDRRIVFENASSYAIDVARFTLRGPFAFARNPGSMPRELAPGARAVTFVEHDSAALAGGPVGSLDGELAVFVEGWPDAFRVPLQSDPPSPAPCVVDVPDDLDLGVIGPPRILAGGGPGLERASGGFVLPVSNPSERACWVVAEVDGFLDHVEWVTTSVRPVRRDRRTRQATSVLSPGESRRVVVQPSPSPPPGPATGAVRFWVPGAGELAGRVEVRADIERGAADVVVASRRETSDPCRPEDGLSVRVEGPDRVRAARLLGARADEATVVAEAALPAPTPTAIVVEPAEPGRTAGGVVLELETTAGTRRVPLAFAPPVAPWQVDFFEQLGTSKIDVLIVRDDSASMAPWAENLAVNVGSFLQLLRARGRDFRLFMATTTPNASKTVLEDLGSRGRAYVDTDDALDRLRPWLLDGAFAGSGLEQILDRVLEAVEVARGAGLRPEAVLSVLVITDEPDSSPKSVDVALNELLQVKGYRKPNRFSLSVVSGGERGCRDDAGRIAEATPKLVELAGRTGGITTRLCFTDWFQSFEEMSRVGPLRRGRFFLTNQPVIQTITVEVDGTRIPARTDTGRSRWIYDFSTNSVAFAPLDVPAPSSSIRVEYAVEPVGCGP